MTPRFRKLFAELPEEARALAFEKYELFKRNLTTHGSSFRQKGERGRWRLDDLIGQLLIDLKIIFPGFGSGRTRITITS
jgi:hypothetical protein